MQHQASYHLHLQDADARTAIDHRLVQPIARALRSLFGPARTAGSPVPAPGTTWQTSLGEHGTVVLNDARGLEIELLSGSLWITQDGDIEDYVLAPSQRFHVRRRGATVVHALEDSSIRIAHPAASAAAVAVPAAPTRAGQA